MIKVLLRQMKVVREEMLEGLHAAHAERAEANQMSASVVAAAARASPDLGLSVDRALHDECSSNGGAPHGPGAHKVRKRVSRANSVARRMERIRAAQCAGEHDLPTDLPGEESEHAANGHRRPGRHALSARAA